jgi:hypothetical protein
VLAQDPAETPRPPQLMDSSGGTPSWMPKNGVAYPMGGISQPIGQENEAPFSHSNIPINFRTSGPPPQTFNDSMMDLGLFGPQPLG